MRVTRALLAIAIVAGAAGTAAAYPQFQLSTGADRCQACHFSPAGGGLVNDYGRSEAGDTISWWGGDGGFLHGAVELPGSFQVGGDYRGVFAIRSFTDETDTFGFPMQLDTYLRPQIGPVALYVAAGLRGVARDDQGSPPDLVDRLTSREHYLIYQKDDSLYVRGGRFYPVFGIRSQDHTAYVRRYMDQYLMEEPYGIAVGRFGTSYEGHLSLFAPQPDVDNLRGGGRQSWGGAAYYEKRMRDDTVALAGQARVAVSDNDGRYAVGTVAKAHLGGVMWMGELDLQLQGFGGQPDYAWRYQIAGYLGGSKMVHQGLLLGGALHLWEADVITSKSHRTAAEVNAQWFPYAHIELHLLGRVESQDDLGERGILVFIQGHYYL
jgi:hypothetical protein